jgi:mono/diheme cytochrome c family protein
MENEFLVFQRARGRDILAVIVLIVILVTVTSGCQPVQASLAKPEVATVEPTRDVSSSAQITVTDSLSLPVAPSAAMTEAVNMAVAETVTAGEGMLDPAVWAAGMDVYHQQYCGVCHTLTAAETTGTFGPTHEGLGATAAQRLLDPTYQGNATTAAEYIRESILDPAAYTVPGYATTSHRMPSYAHLQGATLDALVDFLAAQ